MIVKHEKENDNSVNVMQRIYEKDFKDLLRNANGVALNVSYILKMVLSGHMILKVKFIFCKGNYVEPFKPSLNLLKERSFKSKCEKRWVDKANSLLYEQRPFFTSEKKKTLN